MQNFQKLIGTVLLAGVFAGLLLFGVQHFTTFPLIQQAEVYESAAERAAHHMDAEAEHDNGAWHPSEGAERTSYTALTTILGAIGFSALLFGGAAIASVPLDWRRGALSGVLAFLCFDLAPAWGLPPQPPGAAVADLSSRQLWWVATVIATAGGLWLSAGRRKSILRRLTGLAIIIAPHAVGAPVAVGESAVPADLMHRFAAASIITTAIFWITLGLIGGFLYKRFEIVDETSVDVK